MPMVARSPKNKVTQAEIEGHLRSCGAIRPKGHYVDSKWRHLDGWINERALTVNPFTTNLLAQAMQEQWNERGFERPTIIVASAARAMILGHLLSLHFSLERNKPKVRSLYLEEGPDGYFFPGNYASFIDDQQMILVCDDVIDSGATCAAMIAPVQKARGYILGAISVVKRGKVAPLHLGLTRIVSLYEHKAIAHEPPCPDCERGVKINTDFGQGQKFLEQQGHLISTLPA